MGYDPRTYWDSRAEEQGPAYVGPWGRPDLVERQYALFAEEVRLLLPDREIRRALDYGCGRGRFMDFLLGHAGEYVGADISAKALAMCPETPEGARFVHLDEDRLPFRSGYFDLLVAVTVIQHVPEELWQSWVAPELKRCLKKGGHAVLVEHHGQQSAAHMHCRTSDAVAEALGCEIEERRVIGNHWYARLRRV